MSLDATVGGVYSNAYCDVAYADAYHVTRGFNSEWSAADTASKEAALIWGQRILSTLNYTGNRSSYEQALRWPRYEVYDRDGWVYLSTAIPKCIQDANAELALYLLREDRTQDKGSIGVDALTVGPISIDFSQSAFTKSIPDGVIELIAHTLDGGGSSFTTKVARA